MATHPTKKVPGAKRGRPEGYDKERHCEEGYKLALLGANDEEMADLWKVPIDTIDGWKRRHKEFQRALDKGKIAADANMAERLYTRGCGFERDAVKIFQYEGEPVVVPYKEYFPPDTRAATIWLMNRQRHRNRWNATAPGQQLGTAENPMHHLVASVGQSSHPLTPAITAAIEALAAARLAATEPEVDYIEGDSAEDELT